MNVAAQLMSKIKCTLAKSFIMEMLASPILQEEFTKSLIHKALGREFSEDDYIRLNDEKWIKMKNVISYPYFKRAVQKVTLGLQYICCRLQ